MAIDKKNYDTLKFTPPTPIEYYYKREPLEDFYANIEERVRAVGGKGITVDVLPFEKEGFARLGIRQGGRGQTLEVDVAPGLMTRHGPTIQSPTKGGYAAVFRAEEHLPSLDEPAQFGSPYEKFGQYTQAAFDPSQLQIYKSPNKVWQATVVEGYGQGKLPFGLAGRLPQVGPELGMAGLGWVHGSVGVSFGSAVRDWTAGLGSIFRQAEQAPAGDPQRGILGMGVSPTAEGIQLVPAAMATRAGDYVGPHEKVSGLFKHHTQLWGREGGVDLMVPTSDRRSVERAKPGAITSFEDVGWRTPNYVPPGTNVANPVLVRANAAFGGTLYAGERRIFDPKPTAGAYSFAFGKEEHTQLRLEHMSQLSQAEFQFGIMRPVYEGKGDERTLTGYRKTRDLAGHMVRPGENPIIATYTVPGATQGSPPVTHPIYLGPDQRERKLTGVTSLAYPEGARIESGRGFSGVPFDAKGVELYSQRTRERLEGIFQGNIRSAKHGAWFSAGVDVLTLAAPKTMGAKPGETVESGIQQLYSGGGPTVRAGGMELPIGSITDTLKAPLKSFAGELMTLPVENLARVHGLLGGESGKAAQEYIMAQQKRGGVPGQTDFLEKTTPMLSTGDEIARVVKEARGETFEPGVSGWEVVEELYNKVSDMPIKESWELMRRGRVTGEDVRAMGDKPKDFPLIGVVAAEDKAAWTQEMLYGAALGPEGEGGVGRAEAEAHAARVFNFRPIYRKGSGVSFTQGPTVEELKKTHGELGIELNRAAGRGPDVPSDYDPTTRKAIRKTARITDRMSRLWSSIERIEAGVSPAPSEPVAYAVGAKQELEIKRTGDEYVAEWMAKREVALGYPEQHSISTIFPETAQEIGVSPGQRQRAAGPPPRRSQTWKEMYDVFSHTMSRTAPDVHTELTPDLKRRVREQQASGEKLSLPEWEEFLGGKGPIYNPTTRESYPRPGTVEASAVDKYGLAEMTDPLNYLARNYGQLMQETASDLTREGKEIGEVISRSHEDLLKVFESGSGNWQKHVGGVYPPGLTFGRMGSPPGGVAIGQSLITRTDIDNHIRALAKAAKLPATPRNIHRWTKEMMADPYIETLIGRVPDTSAKHGWIATQGVTAEQVKQRTGLDVPEPSHIGRGGRVVSGSVEQYGRVTSVGLDVAGMHPDWDLDPFYQKLLRGLEGGSIVSTAQSDVAADLARPPISKQIARERALRETTGEKLGVPGGKYNVSAGSMKDILWGAWDISKSGLVVPKKEIDRLPAMVHATSGEILQESLKQKSSKVTMGISYQKRQEVDAAAAVKGADRGTIAAGHTAQLLPYQSQLDLEGLGPTRYESMLQSVIFAEGGGGNEALLLARGSEKAEGHGEIWRSGGTGQWWQLQEGMTDQLARAFGRDVSEGRITPAEAAYQMHMPGSKQFSMEAIEKELSSGKRSPQETLRALFGQVRYDASTGGGLSLGEQYNVMESPGAVNLLRRAGKKMLGGGGRDPRLIKTDKGEMVEAIEGVSNIAFPISETETGTITGALTALDQKKLKSLTEIQQKKTGVPGDPTLGVYDIKTRALQRQWYDDIISRGEQPSQALSHFVAKFTTPGDISAAGAGTIPTMTGGPTPLQTSPTYPTGATTSGIQQPRSFGQVRGAPVFQAGAPGGVPPITPPPPGGGPPPLWGGLNNWQQGRNYGGGTPGGTSGGGNQGASMPYMQMTPGSDQFNAFYQAQGEQLAIGAANVEQSMRIDNYHWGAGKARALAGRQIRTAVSAIGEAGDTQAKSAAAVGKIAAALGVPESELTKENIQRYLSGDPTGQLGPAGAGLSPADRETRELFRGIESEGKAAALRARQVEIGDAAVQSKRGDVGTEPEERQLVEKGLAGLPPGMRETQLLQEAEEWAKSSGVRGTPGAKDFDAKNIDDSTIALNKFTKALDDSTAEVKRQKDEGIQDTPQGREAMRQYRLDKKILGLEHRQVGRRQGIQNLERDLEEATIAGDSAKIGAIGQALGKARWDESTTQDQIQAAQEAKVPLTGGQAASSAMRRMIGGWGLFYMGHLLKMGMGPMQKGYEEYQQYAQATQAMGTAALGAGGVPPFEGAEQRYQQGLIRAGGGMYAQIRRLSVGALGTPFGDASGAAMTGLGAAGLSIYAGGALTAQGMPMGYQVFGKALGGAALPIGLGVAALTMGAAQLAYARDIEGSQFQAAASWAPDITRGGAVPLSVLNKVLYSTVADITSGEPQTALDITQEYASWANTLYEGGTPMSGGTSLVQKMPRFPGVQGQILNVVEAIEQARTPPDKDKPIVAKRLSVGDPIGSMVRMAGAYAQKTGILGRAEAEPTAPLTPTEMLMAAKVFGAANFLDPALAALPSALKAQLGFDVQQYNAEMVRQGKPEISARDYAVSVGTAMAAGTPVQEMAEMAKQISTTSGAPFMSVAAQAQISEMPADRRARTQAGLDFMARVPGIQREMRDKSPEQVIEEAETGVYSDIGGGAWEGKALERAALAEQRRLFGLETPFDQYKYKKGRDWTPEMEQAEATKNIELTRGLSAANTFAQMGFTQQQYAPMVGAAEAGGAAGLRLVEGFARRDPIITTEMAMQGMFGDQQLRGMPMNELFASADIDTRTGMPSGRQWGTTNLQRGNVSAEQMGAKIFSMNVDTLSVKSIEIAPGIFQAQAGAAASGTFGERAAYAITQGLGETFQGTFGEVAVPEYMQGKGGLVAAQWTQKEDAYAYQQQMFGIQRQQLNLQAKYQPQFFDIQDQQRELQYEQAMYGFGQQRRQLRMQSQQFYENMGLQRERGEWGFQYQQMQMGMQRQQFQETMGLQWRQAQWGFQQQQEQFEMQGRQFGEQQELQRRGSMMQRGWERRDWQYQDQMRGMQWGWKQEDFQEEVRFMSGRQRKLAERGMERETTVFNLETDRIDEQRDRQKEMWRLEDERFEMVIRHNEEQRELQEKNMEMQRLFFEEGFKLRVEQFEQQQELAQLNLEKQIEFFEAGMELQIQHHEQQIAMQLANIAAQQAFFLEGYALQEKAADLQRAYWEEQHALSVESLAIQEQYAESAKALADHIASMVEHQGEYQGTLEGAWTDVMNLTTLFFQKIADEIQRAINSIGSNPYIDEYGRRKTLAGGGHVVPGGSYVVGESGPELLDLGVIGTITPLTSPNDMLRDRWQDSMSMTSSLSAGDSGSRTIVINIGNRRLGTYVIDAFTNELEVV